MRAVRIKFVLKNKAFKKNLSTNNLQGSEKKALAINTLLSKMKLVLQQRHDKTNHQIVESVRSDKGEEEFSRLVTNKSTL